MLTSRWTPLKPVPDQIGYRASAHRFNVMPCGRRSGKTERFKRKVVSLAVNPKRLVDGAWVPVEQYPARYFAAAPTRDQAKRIFWNDFKAMVPPEFVTNVSESDLMIATPLAEIWVLGMDRPERIEGDPWDGGGLDEFANMKPDTWPKHVRPALSTLGRMAWCDFFGVPEGRNHYYELTERAKAEYIEKGAASDWRVWHWISAAVLPEAEIEAARRDLDALTFSQEYEASFVNFSGSAYYPFSDANKVKVDYNPDAPLVFCFDFNVSPGVAAVCQEKDNGTGVIGEVHIPQNSNTPAVCKRLIQDWGEHRGRVFAYGDATGGARGTAKVAGSDWDLVQKALRGHYGDRFSMRVPKANPRERSRVNAVNTRIKAGDETIRLWVDPSKAPNVVRDLEGVRVLQGGSGEIDKKGDPKLTHISDALGYYIVREFPVQKRTMHTRTLRVV